MNKVIKSGMFGLENQRSDQQRGEVGIEGGKRQLKELEEQTRKNQAKIKKHELKIQEYEKQLKELDEQEKLEKKREKLRKWRKKFKKESQGCTSNSLKNTESI